MKGIVLGLALCWTLGVAPGVAQTSGTMVPVAPAPAAAKVSGGKLPKADEFSTVALASGHCPGDVVVWSSLAKSKSFHLSGSRWYGTTKHGAYVCEKDALAYGFHQARS
jgi:hypothetical protein